MPYRHISTSIHVYLWKLASSSSSSAATSAPSALASVTFPFRMTNLFLARPGRILPHATVCVQLDGALRVVRERKSAFVYGGVHGCVIHANLLEGEKNCKSKQINPILLLQGRSTPCACSCIRAQACAYTSHLLNQHTTLNHHTNTTHSTPPHDNTQHYTTATASATMCSHTTRQHTKGDIERATPSHPC